MARIRDVLTEALQLSPKQRARVAQELLTSLDDASPEDAVEVERSWAEETRRRLAAIDAGRSKAVPWSKVRRELEADLRKVRRTRAQRSRSRAR
jgi:putative addiction module component (TIGR02574 family)